MPGTRIPPVCSRMMPITRREISLLLDIDYIHKFAGFENGSIFRNNNVSKHSCASRFSKHLDWLGFPITDIDLSYRPYSERSSNFLRELHLMSGVSRRRVMAKLPDSRINKRECSNGARFGITRQENNGYLHFLHFSQSLYPCGSLGVRPHREKTPRPLRILPVP